MGLAMKWLLTLYLTIVNVIVGRIQHNSVQFIPQRL